ncbi:hypothetical protein FQA39_LY13630 [Lamprigera yunnana]|nr:hypothetical protein FQA39_LY13630 [Lamprigera yunnana]
MKMNSSELQLNGRLDDSPSNEMPPSDDNANLSNPQSKGAIPKVIPKQNILKRSVKLNNNEEMFIQSDISETTSIPGTYLNDFKSAFFRSNTDTCENCVYKSNGFTPAETNKRNGHLESDSFVEPLYQSSSSSREIDLNFLIKVEGDNSSSSDENELLSISDDGCIYTYKGDQAADLPSSFFALDLSHIQTPEISETNRLDTASPEMDYLEMDFDPGPSGDADSDSQSNADLENTENLPQDSSDKVIDSKDIPTVYEKPNISIVKPECSNVRICEEFGKTILNAEIKEDIPSTSAISNIIDDPPSIESNDVLPSGIALLCERIKETCLSMLSSMNNRTTTSTLKTQFTKRLHCSEGEFTSKTEKIVTPNEDTHESTDTEEKSSGNSSLSTMIWSEHEASVKQITQIGPSACGATAVLNVLNALGFPIASVEAVHDAVKTRLRENSSPLTEYLLSRSVSGSTHVDLIDGLHSLTDGQVYSRFFHMYPERVVNLSLWLQFWIKCGAVPIATLNLQKCVGDIPDAWHHQMIYGVGPCGIYLTNPLECVEEGQLWPQLISESVLLIRKEDVLSRWNMKTDLQRLMSIKDEEWGTINVVGQVANLVRENLRKYRPDFRNTSHIKIPAAYSAGITLVMRRAEPLSQVLRYYPELPLLSSEEKAAGYSENLS